MVDESYTQQIAVARQSIENQQQEFARARREIESYQTRRTPTKAEIFKTRVKGVLVRKQEEFTRKKAKAIAMANLQKQEQEFNTEADIIRSQIAEVEKQVEEQKKAEEEYNKQVAASQADYQAQVDAYNKSQAEAQKREREYRAGYKFGQKGLWPGEKPSKIFMEGYRAGKGQTVYNVSYSDTGFSTRFEQPIEVYKNILTGEVKSSKEAPSNLWLKAYATPSGKVLETPEQLSDYLKANRIKTSPASFQDIIKPTYYDFKQTQVNMANTPIEKKSLVQLTPFGEKIKKIASIEIPIISKVRADLLTPKDFMIEPGASVRRVPATPEMIARAKQIGERPTMIKYKPGFVQYAEAGLLPRNIGEATVMAGTAALGGWFAYKLPTTMAFVAETIGTKSVVDYTKSKNMEEKASAAVGSLGLLATTGLAGISIFGKKPYKITATPELEAAVQPFSRQRATLFLKTPEGKYLLAKSNGNQIISIGGGIEEGQTIKQALATELKQETGLGFKDISNLRKVGKVVTPEETFHTFVADISRSKISKIKPSSDVRSIVEISPNNPFIKGVTGQTAFQPISRYVPFRGKVRSYEAGLINYIETGKKPTWLAVDTKQGTFILGTQSRYNVPYSSQKQFLKQEELLLAHGTPQPPVLKRWILGQKKFIVEAGKTQRGAANVLYVQPPVSSKRQSAGYIGLSYLGFKTSQESLGTKISFPKRTALLFKEKPSKAIIETPKTKIGMEEELGIVPGTKISTTGRAEVASIGFKKVYLQPVKIVDKGTGNFKASMEISDFASYRYITPGEAVAPISSVSFIKRKKSISPTIISKNQKVVLPSDIIKQTDSKLSISKFSSKSVESFAPIYSKSSNFRNSIAPSLSKPSISKVIPNISKINIISRSRFPQSTGITIPSRSKVPQSKSYPPSRPYIPSTTYTPPSIPKRSSSKVKSIISKIKQQGFNVQIKTKGKFKTVGENLPFNFAKKVGSQSVSTSLSQRFRIIPSGTTTRKDIPFSLSRDIFTTPKRKTSPIEFVERRGKTLKRGTGEISQIQRARRIKWM